MLRIAIFPGSFDPFTIGHADIVRRALPLFDRIIIGIGQNSLKTPLYSIEQRIEHIRQVFQSEPKVQVEAFEELTIDFACEHNANYIIRGVRTIADFEYEQNMAIANRQLANIETIILYTKPEYQHISSTLVRDLAGHGYDIKQFLA